jgi:hypothetical protein
MINNKNKRNVKRSIIKTFTVLTSVIFGLILSECFLRVIGYEPWRNKAIAANEPPMHSPDPLLGWRNKKGKYIIPPYHPTERPIYITFLENGQRNTGINSTSTKGEMIIVGGSFSQGWAVGDRGTYAWKLQQKYPFLKVMNHATGGYGSYQSLLVLEQELPNMTSPKLILYGFIDHHETRNVAPGSWLRVLSEYSKRGHVDAPFATFDEDNGIVRHLPERYFELPFREFSAIISLVERVYMKIKTRKRFNKNG